MHKIRNRARAKFVVTADINNFYPSLYTHTIPWALMGKAEAKRERKKGLGNLLDSIARLGQDGQTVGIPIGPDTSLVLAEILLTAVDHELEGRLSGRRIIRYVDDIEISCRTRAEADEALTTLQEILDGYELSLNPRKTRIVELPEGVENPWVGQLRRWNLRSSAKGENYDLIAYFDEAFRLARERPDQHVLEYAVARFDRPTVASHNWPLLQQLLLQAVVVEPGVVRRVVPQLARHAGAGYRPDLSLIGEVLTEEIVTHAPLGHGSEVAWAVWGAMSLRASLGAEAAAAVVRMSDDVVALLSLDAERKRVFADPLDSKAWAAAIRGEELRGEHWLLAYEAARLGWLPMVTKPPKGDPLAKLLASGVGFYNPKATAPPPRAYPRRAWAVAYL